MDYRVIDWKRYPRRAHFEYCNSMADPYAGVTAEVDITRFLMACRGAETPFFLSFLYCAGRAANAVPELRQRILDGRPVEFASCDTSHTVLRPDGAYSYCRLNCMQAFGDYLPTAQALQEEAKTHCCSSPRSPGCGIRACASRRPARRTATPGSLGGSMRQREAGPSCPSPCWSTTPWWTGCIWGRFSPRWRTRWSALWRNRPPHREKEQGADRPLLFNLRAFPEMSVPWTNTAPDLSPPPRRGPRRGRTAFPCPRSSRNDIPYPASSRGQRCPPRRG